MRTYDVSEGWSQTIQIEIYTKKPFHPSVACLPDGRCVVAYSCEDGIVTMLVDLSSIEPEEQ